MNPTHITGRFAAASFLLFLAACATPPARHAAPMGLSDANGSAAIETSDTAVLAAPKRRVLGGDSYTIGKVGAFMPAGDLDGLDDGLAAELLFGHKLMPFLSIEGSLGYLNTEGQFGFSQNEPQIDGGLGSVQFELDAIPLFVNGRLSLPILILEAYGGVGIGGMYADWRTTGGSSDSDFVLAYQAFVGLEVGIGNLALGAEYKYVQSDDTSDNFSIEGGIASLFVSVPF